MSSSSPWTQERVTILQRLWTAGVPANAIARELGANISRNAVIGKAVRLGLRTHKKTPALANEVAPPVASSEPAKPTLAAQPRPKKPKAIDVRKGRGNAAARQLSKKQKRQAEKNLAAKIEAAKRAAREAAEWEALEEANRLAAVKRGNAEARLALNRKLGSGLDRPLHGSGATEGPPFDALRRKWLTAVMHVYRIGHLGADAEGALAAKRLIEEIEAEWDRLVQVRRDHPDFFEWPSTDAKPGDGRIKVDGWEAAGMLGYLSYRVGKSSDLNEGQRQLLLSYAFASHLPPLNNIEYVREWGPPKSAHRLKKIADSIATFVRLRKHRRDAIYDAAIRDWEGDLSFLHQTFYAGRFRFDWPRT